jgi:nitrite reductase/ring-hydroxylating ferredoxin subunit
MPEFVRVGRLSEIPAGGVKTVVAGDYEIALFNVLGTLYAVENLCPHQGAPLADGWIDPEARTVTCSWHGWCFDLRNGGMTLGDGFEGIPSFDVHVDGDEVYVALRPRRPADVAD